MVRKAMRAPQRNNSATPPCANGGRAWLVHSEAAKSMDISIRNGIFPMASSRLKTETLQVRKVLEPSRRFLVCSEVFLADDVEGYSVRLNHHPPAKGRIEVEPRDG